MNLTRQTLRVYAAIASLRERTDDDVLDALIPFLLPTLKVFRGRKFLPQMLVAGAKLSFGWTITTAIAEAFQARLAARGYLKAQKSGNETSWICSPPDDEESLTGTETDYYARLQAVSAEFSEFCTSKGDLFAVSKNHDELEEILIKFLVSLDAFSKETIINEVRNIYKNNPDLHPLDLLPEGVDALSASDKYLCARFIKHLYHENAPSLDYLGSLAGVGLLTEVVQDFLKPVTAAPRSNLIVVLDAPVAMELLGLAGRASKTEMETVVQSLRSVGCRFAVFPISCDEISRVLATLVRTPRSDRFGSIHTAIISGEVSEDFVHFVKNDPAAALDQIGIDLRQISIDDYPKQHRFFSQDLLEDFIPKIQWISADARFHDAECLTIVMRLREGTKRRDPLQNKFIFVTSNKRFARQARQYCISKDLIDEQHCGPVVHHNDLATAAWLRTGFGAGQSVPRGHLVKICGDILNVKREVVQKAREIIRETDADKLRQYELLLLDRRAVTRLMDRSYGTKELLIEEDGNRLLNDMLRATTEMVEQGYQRQLKEQAARQARAKREIESNYTREIAARDSELEKNREQLKAANDIAEKLQHNLHKIEKEQYKNILIAVNLTNKSIENLEYYLYRSVIAMTILSILELIYSYSGWPHPLPKLRWLSFLIGFLGIIYIAQDFVLKKKFVIDDILHWWAFRRLKRELINVDVPAARGTAAVRFSKSRLQVAERQN